jgi:hypothetical protein
VLADLALKWILESIKEHDPESLIVSGVDGKIRNIRNNMISENRKTGDGDVYKRIAEYLPFGKLGMKIWRTISSPANAIYELLFALRDRHIPDDTAAVYDYMIVDPAISNTLSIQRLARIDNLTGNRLEDENKRYPSSTFQAWILRR